MTRALVVLRPEPGNAATVAAVRELGLNAIAAPLFAVEPAAWEVPAAEGFDGLLAGSANLFRLGGAALASLRTIPVHAVGSATAQAARDAGFAVAHVARGGLQQIVSTLTPGHYLRLAGKQHVPLTLPANVTVDTRVVYATRPLPLDPVAITALRDGAVALLHSGEAALHFADECDRAGLPRSAITLACLAPRIAELAGPGWEKVCISAEPVDDALLALAARMCQTV